MTIPSKTRGQRIKELREKKGYRSQRAFAKAVPMSQSGYSKLENDTYDNPRELARIAKLLNTTVEFLEYGEESSLIPANLVPLLDLDDLNRGLDWINSLSSDAWKDWDSVKYPGKNIFVIKAKMPVYEEMLVDQEMRYIVDPDLGPENGLPAVFLLTEKQTNQKSPYLRIYNSSVAEEYLTWKNLPTINLKDGQWKCECLGRVLEAFYVYD